MPRKHKDIDWPLPTTASGALENWAHVNRALLMDIRDELKQLNATLGCYRLGRMTEDVARIDRRLQKHMPLPKGRRA